MTRDAAQQANAREALWRRFADAHRVELTTHGHGLLWNVNGKIEGLDLWVSERMEGEGLELGAIDLLAPSLGFVVLDAAYRQWFDDARARVADLAAAQVDAIMSRRADPLQNRNPFAASYGQPHRYAGARPTTNTRAFDDRFEILAGNVADLSATQLTTLADLPQCMKMMASGGRLWVHLPLVSLEELAFEDFITTCRAFQTFNT